ncbi:MAG: shikimate dehydrogenase [Verrucomicrobia bacterium]|nr:shikimate dehydrogenase [Verrucomicrobiota bacterium]
MSAPDTLTLADLRTAAFAPGQLGVLGDPIAHSLSPAMHNAALTQLAPAHPRLAGVRYHRLHVRAEELPEALTLLHARGFAGLNLTVPHKVQALTLVATLSPQARRAASVNTLVRTPAGWDGHTTDGQGFLEALRERTGGTTRGRPVVLLGSGGAARAVAAACLADGCASLHLHNRDAAKAADLAASLADARVRAAGLAEIKAAADAVIVNCTTLGLKPADASPLPAGQLAAGQFVFDTTYGTEPSRLLRDARERGVAGCDGRAMLRWQGALAFRLWNGMLPPDAPMRAALGETAP